MWKSQPGKSSKSMADNGRHIWSIFSNSLFATATATAAKSCQSCPTVQPHRRQPTRLPRPWDSPGKNTGVGCHFPLQCMKVKSESEVAQSCPTLSNLMDCSLPGSSIHGIFQARVLEWGAIAFPTKWYYSLLVDTLIQNQQMAFHSSKSRHVFPYTLIMCCIARAGMQCSSFCNEVKYCLGFRSVINVLHYRCHLQYVPLWLC